MKERFASVINSILALCRRFPLALCFLCAVTIFLCVDSVWDAYRFKNYLWVFVVLELIANGILPMVMEASKNKKITILSNVAVHSVIIMNVLWISLFDESLGYAANTTAAIAITLLLGLWCVVKCEDNDLPAWNFVAAVSRNVMLSYLYSLFFFLALLILYWLIVVLYGINWNSNIAESLAVVSFVTMPVLITLAKMPSVDDPNFDIADKMPFVSGMMRYLFIPVVALYMLIILISIPKSFIERSGDLSVLVFFQMLLVAIVVLSSYSRVVGEYATNSELFILKWLPRISLLFIVLMSADLVIYFIANGLTSCGAYMLVFNLWFYMVCLALMKDKMRHIRWLPISFAAVLFVTTAMPLNLMDIDRINAHDRVEQMLTKYGYDRPIISDEFEKLRGKMSDEDYHQLLRDYLMLRDEYGRSSVADLIESQKDDIFYWNPNDSVYSASDISLPQ